MTLALMLALSLDPQAIRLYAGCDSSSEVVAEMKRDTKIEVRYSIAGSSPACYAVTAMSAEGKPVRGYLEDAAVEAIQTYERQRAAAERAAFQKALPGPMAQSAPAPAHVSAPTAETAAAPVKALEEPKVAPKKPLPKRPDIEF